MRFQAVIKNAKLSGRGVNINIQGGDDLSMDELRCFIEQPCVIDVSIANPAENVIVDPVTGEIGE